MTRPHNTHGALASGALLALLLAAAPATAQPAPATADPVVDVPGPPPLPAIASDDPGLFGAPPPLDAVERPPAFSTDDAGGFLWSFVKSMLMLAAVLALIYLVLHKGLGRLVARTQMGRRMRVVERIALDQRRALYLVEVDGQELLLAGTDGGMVAVDMPGGRTREEPATPASPATRFSTDLGKTGRPPPVSGGIGEEGGSRVQGSAHARSREGAEG